MTGFSKRGFTATAAILGVAAVSVFTHLHWLSAGEIDWDEGVYWLSLQSMHAGHHLFTEVYSSQPPAFLLFAEPPWLLLGRSIAAARGVMLFWATVALLAAGVIGWRLVGPVAGVAATALLAVDPIWVRESVVLQADMPAVSLALVALALASVATTSQRARSSVILAALAGAAFSLGMLTKLFDAAVLPPLLALLAVQRTRIRLLISAVMGALVAAAAVLVPLHDAWLAIWTQSVSLHVSTRSVGYGESIATVLGQSWYIGLIAAAGAMLGWRKHRRLVLIAMLWVGGATAAIAATHPLWPHHALALSPGYALAGAAGIAAVAKWLRAHVAPSNIRAALLGCVAAAAFAGLLAPGFAYLRVVADSRPIVNALRQLTPAGSDVLGDEQFDQALAGRLAPAQFIDTSVTRLVGSGVTAKRLEDALQGDSHVCAVLFATNRLSTRAGFETWVAEHATQRIEVRDATVYLLRRCAT